MGTIQSITRFPYKGKAFNFTVQGTEENSKIKKSFYDGIVHPDYPVYLNSGTVSKASEIKTGALIMDRDNTFWEVEVVNEYLIEEDFLQIAFDDGRILRCSLNHKLLVTSPKKCNASTLESGDVIKDQEITMLTRHVKKGRKQLL